MGKIEDWLGGIPSENTRKSYKNGIKKFEKFYKKPIETLIASENAGKIIEKFYVWLKQNGYAQNTCRNIVNAPIQFLKYFDTPIKYRKSLGIYRTVPTTQDHIITIDQVQEMAKVADLREQILLEVFLMGLRIGDASRLKWKIFDVKDKAPIPIMILTKKEEVVARTFISEEFKGLLDKYLDTIDKTNPYLFQSSRNGYLTTKRINAIFKDLGKRAGIKTHGLYRWHIGRKLFLRTCAELGINQWHAKMLCGKSISPDISTYLNGTQLKNDFLKLSRVLRLFPETTPQQQDQIKQLKDALIQLEKENKTLKTRIEVLQEKFGELDKMSRFNFKDIEERLSWIERKLKKKEKVKLS